MLAAQLFLYSSGLVPLICFGLIPELVAEAYWQNTRLEWTLCGTAQFFDVLLTLLVLFKDYVI